jgi:hypothetical protein
MIPAKPGIVSVAMLEGFESRTEIRSLLYRVAARIVDF